MAREVYQCICVYCDLRSPRASITHGVYILGRAPQRTTTTECTPMLCIPIQMCKTENPMTNRALNQPLMNIVPTTESLTFSRMKKKKMKAMLEESYDMIGNVIF